MRGNWRCRQEGYRGWDGAVHSAPPRASSFLLTSPTTTALLLAIFPPALFRQLLLMGWIKSLLSCSPWTAKRSKQSILKEISPDYSLEGLMLRLKLQYFGHLM